MTAAVSSSIVTSIDNEEPALWAQGEKGEISGHFTQCCCEFKPALKKKKRTLLKNKSCVKPVHFLGYLPGRILFTSANIF
jgi:hypothetical protein